MARPLTSKDQSRIAATSPNSYKPDFNFMVNFPPMGRVTPAYQAELGVRDNKDYQRSDAEEAYRNAHADDQEKRDTDDDSGSYNQSASAYQRIDQRGY